MAAAWLKASGGGAANPLAWLGLPAVWVSVVGVGYELLLSGWLLSGVRRPAALLAAAVTFGVFAALTARAGWAGQATCGCLGEVRLGPWWVLLLDLAVLAVLVAAVRRDGAAVTADGLARFAGCTLAAAGGWTAAAVLTLGTSDALVAYLRGHRLVPLTSVLDLGPVPAGYSASGVVALRNLTDTPVTVVGGSSDCTCTLIDDLPLVVPPHGEGQVTVRVRFPAGRGEFSHRGVLWTDAEGRRPIPITVVGRSTGP